MAKTTPLPDQLMEEEYIDMDLSSSTTFPCPPHQREFEFHMSSPLQREPAASPADELFYKGKLLPLHLPPRLQMVEKLEQSFTTNTTPFQSCNVSPATSCYVSGELNPEDYFYECAEELVVESQKRKKKPWSKKLTFIKQSSLGLKLKASKAYFKSLFTKTGCSEATEFAKKKNPFGQIQSKDEDGGGQRRSFSSAFVRHSATTSCSSSNSSSFSSASSNGSSTTPALKRSSSANSELENSIQGMIAYCKKSQQQLPSVRKSVSDVGLCFISATRIAAECEKPEDF
ncbi:probable membrane-associated kinase regulator 4 [Typha latifolia]|uniref:probable membrane-associated kinase regulator 4 n=1 Tax=Typha latifolia TaxID=4733 RepID=UPI003C30E955